MYKTYLFINVHTGKETIYECVRNPEDILEEIERSGGDAGDYEYWPI